MLLDCILGLILSDTAELSARSERRHAKDLSERPAMAALHQFCGEVMLFAGPMLWAALILLFVKAEFFAQ